jgi:hypothetical protein
MTTDIVETSLLVGVVVIIGVLVALTLTPSSRLVNGLAVASSVYWLAFARLGLRPLD